LTDRWYDKKALEVFIKAYAVKVEAAAAIIPYRGMK